MSIQQSSAQISRPPSRTRRALLASSGVFVVFAAVIFFGIGRWLVVEDPLGKARAIVVLSGAMPLRAIEAGKLYREGYAPEVWLTQSTEPAGALQEMGIPFTGEDYYNKLVLIHEGVPAKAIHVLEPPIVNTADEIRVAAAALAHGKGEAVIIVTTKAHTRRTRLLWRRLAPGRGRAIVRAASGDSFDPRHWWRTTSDALDVVREALGLLNAWAGLPLHPAR
ncbi:MAG TPA: ElyC/SanA/YdcF family protein [Candidatus Acidoferrum sp.]|nr:ElyC/SanA/YdcF family protein [Candidatus Acidoferrum sp.]